MKTSICKKDFQILPEIFIFRINVVYEIKFENEYAVKLISEYGDEITFYKKMPISNSRKYNEYFITLKEKIDTLLDTL